jgi:hypothetical protein
MTKYPLWLGKQRLQPNLDLSTYFDIAKEDKDEFIQDIENLEKKWQEKYPNVNLLQNIISLHLEKALKRINETQYLKKDHLIRHLEFGWREFITNTISKYREENK